MRSPNDRRRRDFARESAHSFDRETQAATRARFIERQRRLRLTLDGARARARGRLGDTTTKAAANCGRAPIKRLNVRRRRHADRRRLTCRRRRRRCRRRRRRCRRRGMRACARRPIHLLTRICDRKTNGIKRAPHSHNDRVRARAPVSLACTQIWWR